MIIFNEPNYEDLKENARKKLFTEIEACFPKSKWAFIMEVVQTSCSYSRTGLDIVFGASALITAVILLKTNNQILGFFFLVLSCLIIIKELVRIYDIVKEYKEIDNILPEWKTVPYEICLTYAEKYKDNEVAHYAALAFIRRYRYIKKLMSIAVSEILNIYEKDIELIIEYTDELGNIEKFSHFKYKIHKNVNISEEELKVEGETLIYILPYDKTE